MLRERISNIAHNRMGISILSRRLSENRLTYCGQA